MKNSRRDRPAKQIFFDPSGKRKATVNIVAPILGVLLIILVFYTSINIYRLVRINNSVGGVEEKQTQTTNTALFYTANHPNARTIYSDQIENIDNLIVPRYLVDNQTISTPEQYDIWAKDLKSLGEYRAIHYSTSFVISTKDYSLPPTERNDFTDTQTNIATKYPEYIKTEQMKSISTDMKNNNASTLYVETDLANLKQSDITTFNSWISEFKLILKDSNINLGIICRAGDIDELSAQLLKNFDDGYITFDQNQSINNQIQNLVTYRDFLATKNTIEVPSVSTEKSLDARNDYLSSVDYASVQNNIINSSIVSRSVEPIEVITDSKVIQINDAVTISNVVRKLNDSGVINKPAILSIANPGYEEYTSWSLLKNPIDTTRNYYLLSQNLKASLNIESTGQGTVYSLNSQGTDGTREISIDENNIITTSKVTNTNVNPKIDKSGKLPKKVALTFDDGPHPTRTKLVIDILDKYKVKGTFFLVGENVAAHPGIAKMIVAHGNEVENHSYNHPIFDKLPEESQINQLKYTSEIISEVTGQNVSYFRQPYSSNITINTTSDITYLEELQSLGLRPSEYDIDSKDWLLETSEQVFSRVKTELDNSNGEYSQILFHDTHNNINTTLESLPKIIEYLQANKIEIMRVDQLTKLNEQVSTVPDTSTYKAVVSKDYILTLSVMTSAIMIVLSLIRYFWIVTGSVVYLIKYRLIGYFFKRINTSQRKYPSLAVVIACYNEELVIAKSLDSLLKCNYPRLRIIVVNDGSKDNTKKIIENYAAKHKNITAYTTKNGGKARALDFGIKQTKAKWLVFCDADTIFDKNALHSFADSIFTRRNIGAVAGNVLVGNQNNMLTRAQVIEYGISHRFIKTSQDVINGITVVPGAIGIWNHKALDEVNGFTPDTLAEDADATMKIIGLGKEVRYSSTALAKTEVPDTIKMHFKQRTRWQLGNMQAIFKHRNGLFKRHYGSLGFFTLPMFYTEMLTTLLYPWLAFSTFYIAVAQIKNWDIILPQNISFARSHIFVLLSISVFAIELILAIFVIITAKKSLKSKALLFLSLPYYIFIYRSLISYATFVSFMRALKGNLQSWGHLKRTSSVE